MAILIDSNVLIAAVNQKDMRHQQARTLLGQIEAEQNIVVIPVLSEVFYFTSRNIGYRAAINVFTMIATAFEVEQLTIEDLARMQVIMDRYEDAGFDFADAAIMAASERLNITRIVTFDRRDFDIYRPAHTDHYELLP